MYGSTPLIRTHFKDFLQRFAESGRAIHPLLLPMMFAEMERKRFFTKHDAMRNTVKGWDLDIRAKLNFELANYENTESQIMAVEQSTALWISLGRLRNGMISMKDPLRIMLQHSQLLNKTFFRPVRDNSYCKERSMTQSMEKRLEEMLVEFDGKIRDSDATLGGLGFTAQTVSTNLDWGRECVLA